MQEFTYLKGTEEFMLSLPDADTEILKNVRWGDPCALFTPAYWCTQYLMRDHNSAPNRHRIGHSFAEEVAACLLGGHGIPAEVGNAAFARLKQEGLIQELCDNTDSRPSILHPLSIIFARKICLLNTRLICGTSC